MYPTITAAAVDELAARRRPPAAARRFANHRRRTMPARAATMIVTVAVAAAAFFGHGTDARASTTSNGCTVTPKTPLIWPELDELGRKVGRYPITFSCKYNHVLDIEQQAFEQDNGKPGDTGGDDVIYNWTWRKTFGSGGGSVTVYPNIYVSDTDSDANEELGHRVRFKVTSHNGVEGSWTPWEQSSVISVTP